MLYDTRIQMIEALVPKGSVVAEIGIFQGVFSRSLYETLSPRQLFLLDLFSGGGYSGDHDGNHVVYADLEQSYMNMISYSFDKPAIRLVKGDSSTLLKQFPDDAFDMIYIDGDHRYEGCKKDLLEAYKKVKSGGYICGHDYEMNMEKAQTVYEFGVKQAVDEFCVTHGQTICAKGNDGCVSYAIQIKK